MQIDLSTYVNLEFFFINKSFFFSNGKIQDLIILQRLQDRNL